MTSVPLVSVVLATRDSAATLGRAVASVLRQSLEQIELVVVDDGSTDGTDELLAGVRDPRLVVVRNDEPRGLAASLNAGFAAAGARHLARLDADDVAHPQRLELQLRRIGDGDLAVLGTGVLEISEHGRPGALHRMPAGASGVRWRSLFGSPFFHPTTLIDRAVLDRHDLRYDPRFEQSQDYELWTRVLGVAEGDNLPDALVLRGVHAGQASRHRRGEQRGFQREIALAQIRRVAPGLTHEEAELAWLVGAGEPLPTAAVQAVGAYEELLRCFLALRAGDARARDVRVVAARAIMRAALAASPGERASLLRRAHAVDPVLAARGALDRARRRSREREARGDASRVLAMLARDETPGLPVRVAVVSPEPTPYRSPLFDRIAESPDVELTVVYAARTVAGRTWHVEPRHAAVFLHGARIPGVRRIFRHDYPVTPGVTAALRDADPDVVVVSGWSTYASQVAVLWCRRRRIPYLLIVESHDADPRPGWRRAVKRSVVPRVVRHAAAVLATGTLAGDSMIAWGAAPERVHVFANTIDVAAWSEQADRLAARRPELRTALGLAEDDVAVLSVARLAPEKRLDVLLRATAAAGDERLVVVLAGSGPERDRLERLARELGVRLVLAGDVAWHLIAETYAAADVFALLSDWEPWGVVVNEAAACGLPLVLSDRIGAAADLLVDGENGVRVAAGDVEGTAKALRRYATDPSDRLRAGARSRELVTGWGYGPSVSAFVAAAREAVGGHSGR